jgi:hypothetical protein
MLARGSAQEARFALMDVSTLPTRAVPTGCGTGQDWGTTMLKHLELAEVYQLLEPGPVVLLATAQGGRANVMTMSWHMMVEFEPPLIACVVSGGDYSFAALRATRECVIAVPAVAMA